MRDRIAEVMTAMGLEYADILGPNPCALARLKSKYRYDMLVRTHSAGDLRRLIVELEVRKAMATKTSSVVIDVDPVSLG